MEHVAGRFRGYKNLNLYYQCWLPTEKPKALLLIVHGLAEHSGRYSNLAGYFVAKGYAVYACDYQGHGQSEGLRGYVERFPHYFDDLKAFLDIVHRQQPDTRIFLFGHSMGGTIATAYAIHHQAEFSGLILSAASLKIDTNLSSALITVGNILSRLLPKTGLTVLDATAISRNRAIVDAYINDPLVYRGKIRARLGSELIRITRQLPGQMPELNLPILIMHGTADRLSDPKGSKMLYERASSRDKTLKLYDGFYHEIFNEPGHEQVLADIAAWLAAHL